MRICLLAWGSRGDVQPLLALGRGLSRAGHSVAVAATREFTPSIAAAGLTPEPFDVDLHAEMYTPLGLRWLEGSSRSLRREGDLMRRVAERLAPIVVDRLIEVVDRHEALISGVMTFGALLGPARLAGRPHVLASLAPGAPTRSGAATLYPVRPTAESWLNLAGGWLTAAGTFRVLRPVARELERRTGSPRQTFARYVRDATRTPVLLGVSPHVVPPPPDVEPRVVTTGYWTEAVDPDRELPADLVDFLGAGSPPCYVGFGSMPTSRPDHLFAVFVAASRRAGRRALVHGTWGGWRPDTVPDDVLLVDDVPHERLFPRVAGVVHHGGAGTTGSAIRAGVPQVVVPHMGDQPYWGRRVAELGLGPTPIPRHALDADRLAAAIEAMTRPGPRAAARALGEKVRAEDGVGAAVAAFDRLVRGRPDPTPKPSDRLGPY